MAGLVPAIHVFKLRRMAGGFVYIMANRRDGVLYVGVTSNLLARAYQHREGIIDGFTKQYGLKLLVYYEPFDDIRLAIQRREKYQALATRMESAPYSCDESRVGGSLHDARPLNVMPALVAGIHVFTGAQQARRGWPGQVRP
jgi:putative endonuclease